MSTDRRVGRPVIKSVAFDTPSKANTARRLLADIRELAPGITRARRGDRGRAADSARSGGSAEIDRRLSHVRAAEPWRVGARPADGAGDHHSARPNRRFGRLDRDDQQRRRIFTPSLPRETYEQVYRNGPDVAFAGSTQPVGTAEATAGGWRVSGRWPFASGCQHADWMAGFCVMTEGGKPLPGEARTAADPRRLPARARLADRGHLVRRRTQGHREPSHRPSATWWSRR